MRPEERHLLQDWVRAQATFPECLRPQDLELCRQQRLDFLESSPELVTFRSEAGFVTWNAGSFDRDTGRPVALLWAYEAPGSRLAPLLARSAETLRTYPLVWSIFSSQEEMRSLLTDNGYYPLRHFVTKTTAETALKKEWTEQYRLRLANEADRSFWGALAMANAVHTLPPNQEKELARLTQTLLESLLGLDIGPQSDYDLLIAEGLATGTPLGYLLIKTDNNQTATVVDIGVKKSHRGLAVAQFLVFSTENLLWAQGFRFLVGEISAANHRSYRVACEVCGFQPNRELWRKEPRAD